MTSKPQTGGLAAILRAEKERRAREESEIQEVVSGGDSSSPVDVLETVPDQIGDQVVVSEGQVREAGSRDSAQESLAPRPEDKAERVSGRRSSKSSSLPFYEVGSFTEFKRRWTRFLTDTQISI